MPRSQQTDSDSWNPPLIIVKGRARKLECEFPENPDALVFFLSVHVSRSGKYYFVKLSRCRSKKTLLFASFIMWFVCQSIHQLFEILKSTSTGGFNLLRVPEYCSFQKVCFSILIRNTATLGELFLDNLPGSLLFSMNEIITLQIFYYSIYHDEQITHAFLLSLCIVCICL